MTIRAPFWFVVIPSTFQKEILWQKKPRSTAFVYALLNKQKKSGKKYRYKLTQNLWDCLLNKRNFKTTIINLCRKEETVRLKRNSPVKSANGQLFIVTKRLAHEAGYHPGRHQQTINLHAF
jgi:uncharacterized protein (DUF2344 family)